MRIFLLLSLCALALCQIPPQTFQKCQAGSYDVRIRAGQSTTYTTIPKGVIGLKVLLSAIPYDFDITLLNSDSTKWLVFPCSSPRCNALISSPAAASASFSGAQISYSGYKGLEISKPGVEWLEIIGELKEDVKLGLKINVYPVTAPIPVAMRIEWEGAQGCQAPPAEGLDLKVLTNTRNHKTFRYRGVPQKTLITRRGFEFSATVTTQGAKTTNTFVTVPGLEEVAGAITFSALTEVAPNQISFTGKISVNSPVGLYKLNVQSNGKMTEADLVILFNPYLTTDAVYMPNQAILGETVENEEGIIWQGSTYQVFPTLYNYDQFEWVVLDMSLNLLRRMPVPERANIVLVSRHLSFAINSDVCYGKWGVDPPPFEEGQPEDGYMCSPTQICKTPTYWKSMSQLAQVHIAVGRNRVQYCQCFVFAALFTSIGRTMGIPTRPVTNFQSAHDKNGNRAVDRFYSNISGRLYPIEGPIEESVWNFHVWNEMWFTRADLTKEICEDMKLQAGCGDGWQVVDATPQELSEGGSGTPSGEGFYMSGPASVSLVKLNKIHTCEMKELGRESHPRVGCFDQNFVIAEVNANVNIWVLKGQDDYEQKCYQENEKCGFPVDPVSVQATAGQYISTKAPGEISPDCRLRANCANERVDLTLAYKNPEPSWSTTEGRHMWMLAGESPAQIKVGVVPNAATHVINELGSIYSAAQYVAEVSAADGSKVTCAATIVAIDYRGKNIGKSIAKSTIAKFEFQGVVANGKAQCTFTLTRDNYHYFTSSQLLNAAKATSAKFTMSVHVQDVTKKVKTYLEERYIHFCTPKDPLRVLEGEAECAANAGFWRGAKRPACPANPSPKLGDGTCNPELNNAENCYDNGDCCYVSCIARFAGVQGGNNCKADNSQCKEPAFQLSGFGFIPAPPSAGLVDHGHANQCNKITNAIKSVVTKVCGNEAAVCSGPCSQALNALVCLENDWEGWSCNAAKELVNGAGCSWPRCQQPKPAAPSGFFVWHDGKSDNNQKPLDLFSKAQFKKMKEAEQNKGVPQQSSMAVPLTLAGSVGVVVGLLVGVIATRRRQSVASPASLL